MGLKLVAAASVCLGIGALVFVGHRQNQQRQAADLAYLTSLSPEQRTGEIERRARVAAEAERERIAQQQERERQRVVAEAEAARQRERDQIRRLWSSAIIAAHEKLTEVARDPSSVVYRNEQAWLQNETSIIVCGEVNQRNGFGGMTGFQPYIAAGYPALVVVPSMMARGEWARLWSQSCRGERL